jgi:hypothetical protein
MCESAFQLQLVVTTSSCSYFQLWVYIKKEPVRDLLKAMIRMAYDESNWHPPEARAYFVSLFRPHSLIGFLCPFVKKGHSGSFTTQPLAVSVGERSTLTAASAAQQPHIPCTPPPDGVEEEHR